MKMILAILQDSDSQQVSTALVTQGYRVTRIASTGGFLRRGSSTLMIGVESDKVAHALELIRSNVNATAGANASFGTLFVLDVENFTQL